MRKGKPSLPNATSPKAAWASSPKSPQSIALEYFQALNEMNYAVARELGKSLLPMTCTIAMRTVSLTNQREHWSRRAKRAKEQRALVGMTIGNRIRGLLPSKIWLTRIAPRIVDSDNLPAALKSVRDAVADCLGLDDGDERLRWSYWQEKGSYAVRIEVMT